MARLVAAKCPNCGAALRLDPQAAWVTCAYCSTSSFIQHKGRAPPLDRPPGPVIVVPPQTRAANVAVVAGVIGALFVFGVVAAVVMLFTSSAPRSKHGSSTPTSAAISQGRPAESVEYTLSSSRRPLLADVDGDGATDPIVVVSTYEQGATRTSIAAFNSRSGTLVYRTSELGKGAHQLKNAVVETTLLVADDAAMLTGYALASGQQRWAASLGDKLERYCVAPRAGSARLRLEDERLVDLDLSTGAVRAVAGKPACAPAPSDERPRQEGHPRTWKSELMPEEIESYGCGRTRFMGDYNFVLEDRCAPRIKVDTEKLASFSPTSIGRHGSGWLLVGHKSPGSRVPMAGFARPGTLVWSAAVPALAPLEFTEGAPRMLAISGDVLVLPYSHRSGGSSRVAAFQISNGKRLWDVELTQGLRSVDALVASAESAFLVGDSRLLALALANGTTRFQVGRKN